MSLLIILDSGTAGPARRIELDGNLTTRKRFIANITTRTPTFEADLGARVRFDANLTRRSDVFPVNITRRKRLVANLEG